MKRFYKLVSTRKTAAGYEILLDGKPIKSASGKALLAPHQAVADAVMEEWAAQEETIKPADMPLTNILNTRQDRVSVVRAAMQDAALKYFDTDLLCYRTDQPPALAQLQAQAWDPWLEWFAGASGAKLETTTALKALSHPKAAHDYISKAVADMDDDEFTVLQMVTAISGSLILGLAFTRRAIDAQTLFNAMRVEEQFKASIYHEEKYGPDPLQEKRDKEINADLAGAAAYLRLCGKI